MSLQDVPIVKKTKHPVYIGVFGVVPSGSNVMPPSFHMALVQPRSQHQVAREGSDGLDWESGC